MGSIPWIAIDRYAQRYGLDVTDFDELSYVVRAIDRAWLEHPRNRSEEEKSHPEKTRRKSL